MISVVTPNNGRHAARDRMSYWSICNPRWVRLPFLHAVAVVCLMLGHDIVDWFRTSFSLLFRESFHDALNLSTFHFHAARFSEADSCGGRGHRLVGFQLESRVRRE